MLSVSLFEVNQLNKLFNSAFTIRVYLVSSWFVPVSVFLVIGAVVVCFSQYFLFSFRCPEFRDLA